ncbi:MAG TPA: threonine ammonia-lyase, biosynthetic, partial [Hellea balneolensis]|nr:threonine ammonia-lyase, biosynthetic [Hellea balneolensis]
MSAKLEHITALIKTARVTPLARHTPLQEVTPGLYLKREDMQSVFSFKIRGAANRIAHLGADDKQNGVVCASAGNHAQGVARAARKAGIKATIFMPVTTPSIKSEAVRALGGHVRLVGDNYDAACAAAEDYARKSGATFIHPFDDDLVIAGQGTIGREILNDLSEPPAAIYIPVGGGGLLAGVGAWIRTYSPNTCIIAVEPEGAATLNASLKAGHGVSLNRVDGFADGVAVKRIGRRTLAMAKAIDPESLLVSNDEISAAVKYIFNKTRTVVEPAGALALAGALKNEQQKDGPVVVIVSGANVNFDRIGHMVERAELGAGGEILFAATLPERPGAFLKFCEALGQHAVTEFNYRYGDPGVAHVLVGIKISTPQEGETVLANIRAAGMAVTDFTHSHLAKEHIRHMVGGRSDASVPEQVYSFQFPERPGALKDFLLALQGRWNISLFHYRNHGAAIGQVLCGFQTPKGDVDALEASLRATGFAMQCVTMDKAVQAFLLTRHQQR